MSRLVRQHSLREAAPPLEFAASVTGGTRTTLAADGWDGYVYGLAHSDDGTGGCLLIQRADDPAPEEEPYCLIWGRQEGTTYGGVIEAVVTEGEVRFEMERFHAAELGTPTVFRITFPAQRTEDVRAGLSRTLGPQVVR
ncbi:MAG TPA: hypothetical protein VF054_01600 [Micromonosporaceae bacterium]